MKYEIKTANAMYTGGNIYVFTGKFTDGNYFIADSCDGFVRIINDNPDGESEFYDWNFCDNDWQEEHLVEDLNDEKEQAAFIVEICNYIIENKPDGNYVESEIEKIKSYFYDIAERKSAREVIEECKKNLTKEKIIEHIEGLIEYSLCNYCDNTEYSASDGITWQNVLDYPYDGDGKLGTDDEDVWFKDVVVLEKVIELLKKGD